MPISLRRIGLIATGATLLLAVLVGAAVASTYKQGTYAGKTSQGDPLSFAVKDVECGATMGVCLYEVTQPNIELKCPGSLPTNAYADPGPVIVPADGIIHYSVKLFSKVTMTIRLRAAGTATGTLTASGPGRCSSGVVTFKART